MITKPQRVRLANLLYGNTRAEIDTLAPASFWIGLSTAPMGDSGVIANEVSGNGYARVEIANNKTSFSTANTDTDGAVFNQIRVDWPEATASWGTIKTVFFAASQGATSALYYVNVNKEVPAHATLYFKGTASEGDLNLSITN